MRPLLSLLFSGDVHFLLSFLSLALYSLAPGFSSSLLLNFFNPSTSEGGSCPVFLINQKSLAVTTRKASKNAELFGSTHFIIIELPACRVDLVSQFSVEIPSKRLPWPPEILHYTQRHGTSQKGGCVFSSYQIPQKCRLSHCAESAVFKTGGKTSISIIKSINSNTSPSRVFGKDLPHPQQYPKLGTSILQACSSVPTAHLGFMVFIIAGLMEESSITPAFL